MKWDDLCTPIDDAGLGVQEYVAVKYGCPNEDRFSNYTKIGLSLVASASI